MTRAAADEAIVFLPPPPVPSRNHEMPTSDTPESVVQTVLKATVARQWREVFEWMDESDIPRWRRATLSMLRHLEQQPDAEKSFAEWGARSTSELEVLPDEDLFGRWMHAFALEVGSGVVAGQAESTSPPAVQRVVLGSVREGDNLAHVVYREKVGRGTALRIATLRLTGDGWRLRVDHDLLGLGSFHVGPAQPHPGTAG
jgi:hypothetical protein